MKAAKITCCLILAALCWWCSNLTFESLSIDLRSQINIGKGLWENLNTTLLRVGIRADATLLGTHTFLQRPY